MSSKGAESDLDTLDSMDLDYEQYVQSTNIDLSDVVIGTDLSDIVDSICKDGGFPESPPDSGSEHLMSPSSNTRASECSLSVSRNLAMGGSSSGGCYSNNVAGISDDYHHSYNVKTNLEVLPDLNKINYSVPLQMIESSDTEYKSVVVTQGGSVLYQDHNNTEPQIKRRRNEECHSKHKFTTSGSGGPVPPGSGAGVPVPGLGSSYTTIGGSPHSPSRLTVVKTELPLSPDNLSASPGTSSDGGPGPNTFSFPNSIRFSSFYPENWTKMMTSRLVDVNPQMCITADKGFNYSAQDEAFIVQKKNHFQVTCDVQFNGTPRFISKAADGTLHDISYLQVNFYGVKSDIPSTQIKIEQSQTDRSKKHFQPIKIDLNSIGTSTLQVTVGRLHFAETTSNNMRKKGKPNPAQKYFQLVVGLEAIVIGPNGKRNEYEVARMASEKVIVRASNPGQFEADNEPPWTRDGNSDTLFHMGRVAINTEQGSEALTVHGNIQISGQVMQPSDARIKSVMREVDPKEQLKNVNKIKIVQYKYRPEFIDQLPEDEKHRLENRAQTGVIAQDIKKVIPDAVSSGGPYMLSNGEEISDMLIVNKDRLFLENLGAVRELSKVTGHLGHRVEDLERANETVTVRLANLRRGSSTKSTVSTISSESHIQENNYGKSRNSRHTSSSSARNSAKTLFQNKCVQMVLLAMISIIAISVLAMATVYIIDYYDRQDDSGGHSEVFNETKISEIEIIEKKVEEKDTSEIIEDGDHKISSLVPPKTTVRSVQTTQSSSTTTSSPRLTTSISNNDLFVIGSLTDADELRCASPEAFDQDKCRSVCCGGSIEHQNLGQNSNYNVYLNDVYMVVPEPEEIKIIPTTSTTIRSTTGKTTTTESVKDFTGSVADVEKKLERLRFADANEDIEKENQVLDEVTKPNNIPDGKEDKIDKVTLNKDFMTSTEKSNGQQQIVQHKLIPKSSKNNNNSIKKDDLTDPDEDEQFNEVLDDRISENDNNGDNIDNMLKDNDTIAGNITSNEEFNESSNQHQPTQRAKRDINFNYIGQKIGHLVTGLVRRIRATDQAISLDKRSSRYHLVLTGSSIGNITLNNRFCDRSVPTNQLNDCLQGIGFNTSMNIPLSKHYKDPLVTLNIKSTSENTHGNVVICPTPMDSSITSSGNRCTIQEQPDSLAITEGTDHGQFHIHISQFQSIQVKFRQDLRLRPSESRRSVCALSDSKLGTLFQEFHVKFYRFCQV